MLHERGGKTTHISRRWRSATPETIEAYTKQRLRWATSGFEIMLLAPCARAATSPPTSESCTGHRHPLFDRHRARTAAGLSPRYSCLARLAYARRA